MSYEMFVALLRVSLALTLGVHLVPCWILCRRVGLPGGWGLLALVPVLNIAAVYLLTRRICQGGRHPRPHADGPGRPVVEHP
jgi:hypothetical protein